ncbi:lipocalin-like domain-containing protein [Streptococcus sobrinus]
MNGTNYGGVFLKEWDSAREKEGVTFSVLSGDGEAVWGVK